MTVPAAQHVCEAQLALPCALQNGGAIAFIWETSGNNVMIYAGSRGNFTITSSIFTNNTAAKGVRRQLSARGPSGGPCSHAPRSGPRTGDGAVARACAAARRVWSVGAGDRKCACEAEPASPTRRAPCRAEARFLQHVERMAL